MTPKEIQAELAKLASPREDVSLVWADVRVKRAIQMENGKEGASVISTRGAEADHRAYGTLAA